MNLSTTLQRSAAVILCGLATACVGPVPEKGAKETIKYFEAKRVLANHLQSFFVGKDSDKYRLAAVAGPAYGIGAVLDPENPADLATRSCLVQASQLPPPERWAAFPRWTASRGVELSGGLPASFKGALAQAAANVKLKTDAQFEISDISQSLLAQDEFLQHLGKSRCLGDIDKLAKDVLVVRGIILGREALKDGLQFGAGINTKLIAVDSELIRLTYDSGGNFELKDESAVPKFLILTTIRAAERSSLEKALRAPQDQELEKLERASVARQ